MNMTQTISDLFQAVQSNNTTRLKELLDSNPTLANTANEEGLTPLGFAAYFGNKETVQELLDYGAEVNALSHSKNEFIPSNTALHAAIAGKRNTEVIKILLSHNANTNIFDSNGHTCLHTAAFHDDNTEIIQLLIEHGANVNAKVEGGKTSLDLAIEKGNNKVAELLRYKGATA